VERIEDIFPKEKYLAVPMVCFCDIPLKFIDEHVKRYGKYGIAFNKEWALKKGIQPINYRPDGASLSRILPELQLHVNQLSKSAEVSVTDLLGISKSITQLGTVSKPYRDIRNNYIDREWRFVDSEYDPEFVSNYIPELKDNPTRKKLNNEYLRSYHDSCYLRFELNDIEHIVVPTKKETKRVLDFIDGFDTTDNNGELIKLSLAQKVIDLDTVKRDI